MDRKCNKDILITNIQRFSVHDGPGIRTTVFLKGCGLRCPWCCNPENIDFGKQIFFKDGRQGCYGQFVSQEEFVNECLRDVAFYSSSEEVLDWNIQSADDISRLPGGVTFSGGEPIFQIEKLVPVCEQLHKRRVHIAVETSLFVSSELVDIALENIDLFYVDIKILNESICKEVEGGEISLFLKNLDAVFNWTDKQSCHKPIIIRIPVIGTYTNTDNNRLAVRKLLNKYKHFIMKLELIKEHGLAESKYHSLNEKFNYHGVSDSMMEVYKNELLDLQIPIEICQF